MTYKTGDWGKQAKERGKRRLAYLRDYWNKLRIKVIDKYGGKCIKCGFDDSRALQIDHVNGGGRKELLNRLGGSDGYYRKLLKDTSNRYQLLCANCNWIKRVENNETKRKEVSLNG